RALPGGGLRPGTLVEWIGQEGGSVLALQAARQALAFFPRRRAVVVQLKTATWQLSPLATTAWGLPLQEVAWVHVDSRSDLFWTVDQALRSSAVAAVLWWPDAAVGESSREGGSVDCRRSERRSSDRVLRRWQLAAEGSGALGLMVRRAAAFSEPSWADVRWRVHAWQCDELRAETEPRWQFDVELFCQARVDGAPRVRGELAAEMAETKFSRVGR
ncbi:MAG: hypothetical protein KDA61_06195, partial [Planctomycetales bacterium]|nr:hypothetical protein [Planctomycetales bacterium]